MKKNIILYFYCLLCSIAMSQTSVFSKIEQLELRMKNYDTVGVFQELTQLLHQCSNEDWQIQFKTNQLLGEFEFNFHENYLEAITYFNKAYQLYPTNVSANADFMLIADGLALSYEETKQYDKAEMIAADALVRGAYLNDSLPMAIDLFSVLANCHEQRGDTIMPQHFHRKSQMLSILYMTRQYQPDSVERVYNRLYMLYEALDQQKQFFTKDHPAYLYILDVYISQVASSTNSRETIYLGEPLLQTARDSSLLHDSAFFSTYLALLYAYACDDKMEKCLEFLQEAEARYASFAEEPQKNGILYYSIGNGLMDNNKFEKALGYLKESKKRLSKKDLNLYGQEIDDRIAFIESHTK